MHGCGGLFSRTTNAIVSRETAWRQQLVDKGFAVLMVDGFTPRDTVEMCSRTSFISGDRVTPMPPCSPCKPRVS
jgi:hypothetical protein